MLAVRSDSVRNAAWVWHEIESSAHDEAEGIRTLYVAATRAQKRLVLVTTPSQRGQKAPWTQALRAWGYDPAAPPADGARLDGGRVLHRVVRLERLRVEPPDATTTDVASAVRDYEESLSRLRALSAPPLRSPSGLAEDLAIRHERDEVELPDREGEGGGDAARAAGIAVHRLLEVWDLRDQRSLRADLAGMARRVAEEESAEAADVQREAAEVLDAFLASELPSRMQAVTILGREVPLLFQDAAGSSWWGKIDLVYRDSDGRVVVADFKTDREIDLVADRYAPQLAVYAAGVQRAMGLPRPVTAELWLLRYGRRLTLEFR
jgi:ATP-dependent exoDNAse (exonuclease V) beta subunit